MASVIAASPFISRYPEWQETIAEIAAKRKRSTFVAVQHQFNLKYRDPRVQAAVDFMNANLHRSVALAELAGVVNLSPSHLSRLFKFEMGVSPVAHMIRLRLEKAARLLTTSFLSVKQVMASVGYGNRHGFSHHFKRQFGLTPSQYRRRFFHRR